MNFLHSDTDSGSESNLTNEDEPNIMKNVLFTTHASTKHGSKKLIAELDDTEEGPINENGNRSKPIPLALQKAKSCDQTINVTNTLSIRNKYRTPIDTKISNLNSTISKRILPPSALKANKIRDIHKKLIFNKTSTSLTY